MKDTYDYVEEEVKKFWNKKGYAHDVVVFFYQKYEWEQKWEFRKELVEAHSDTDMKNMTFLCDFCEGQTDFKLEDVVSLSDVLDYFSFDVYGR